MIVEVNHLTKKYGNHTAVSDLSFQIEKGKVYGFLGPNGAGKSTTMNIMTGCLSATSGSVKIGGHDIFEEPEMAKKLIGYLPEIPPLYIDRTPREYLHFVAAAKGVSKKDINTEIENAMEKTKITDVADRLIKHLSKGYKQRVGIAQAILGSPELVILDEPTVGLDPKQIIEIRELITELGKDHTVILSSHILSEIQAVCENIIIISNGKIVANDTAENLESLFAGKITIQMLVEANEYEISSIVNKAPNITNISIKKDETNKELYVVKLEANGDSDVNEISKYLFFAFADINKAILQLTPNKASLEDIFIELTDIDKEAKKSSEDINKDDETSDDNVKEEDNESEEDK